jgi:hypothetical protein
MAYRRFDTGTWQDPWFEDLSLEGRMLFIYLWTNDVCNQAGMYQISKRRIEFEVGFDIDAPMAELNPKVEWMQNENIVWIKNFLKWQSQNASFIQAALKTIRNLPHKYQCAFLEYNSKLLSDYGVTTVPPQCDHSATTHPASVTGTETEQKQNRTEKSIGDKKPVVPTRAPAKKFQQPTIEEVKAYCLERDSPVNPSQFMAYYDSNGWRVGKNPMKDWRAAVINWEQREKRGGNGNGRTASPTIVGGAPRVRSDGEYPVDLEVCE